MLQSKTQEDADDVPTAAAVLVLHDGKLLCGVRSDNDQICGPGGHIEDGEAPIQTAIRETQEEFGITPVDLMYMGTQGENGENTHCTAVFLCTTFSGTPKADGKEMHGAFFLSPEKLDEQFGDNLFPPFADSLKMPKPAQIMQTLSMDISDGCGIMKNDEGRDDDGPNSLPYGLCKREGIDTEGLSPSECWEALKEKTGKSQAEFFAEAEQEAASSESTSKAEKSPVDLSNHRPLREGIRYNDYDFADEIAEYESSYPDDKRAEARMSSEERAKQYKAGWAEEDMDEAIHNVLDHPVMAPPNQKGKTVFRSKETSLTVCYDLHSDYFTVIDESNTGRDRYRDIYGKSVLYKKGPDGKKTVRPKGEHMRITHFNRRRR
jgi:8-oxo-dGTP pyrophosphatase MutT (NUDIX family)